MNPWTDLSQILIGEIGRAKGILIAWFKDSKLLQKVLNCKKSDLCKKKAIRAVNNSTFKAHSNPLFSKLKIQN